MAAKQRSKWEDWNHVPAYVWVTFFPLLIGTCEIVALSVTSHLQAAQRSGDPTMLFVAMLSAASGVLLLFSAKLPLYRQRRFFTFGPGALDNIHRKLYKAAYIILVPSLLLLGLLAVTLR